MTTSRLLAAQTLAGTTPRFVPIHYQHMHKNHVTAEFTHLELGVILALLAIRWIRERTSGKK